MLTLIRIRNYAIIDEIEVEFEPGFSVLTGETGAGKSILVDALGLALGDRADASAVRQGASRAEISVLFECEDGHPALAWLAEHGLDDERSCSLRRIISAEGRSRAFVNNQPVTLDDLRTLGALLVDIHGQHAHQSLLQASEQRRLLDASGGLDKHARDVAANYHEWQTLEKTLSERRANDADRSAQIELLRFQLKDLEELGLGPGEIDTLRSEHSRLANVDTLAGGVQTALDMLYEDEQASAYARIALASRELGKLGAHDARLVEHASRLDAAEIELRDVATALMRYRDTLEPDPERLEYVETRLARIRALAKRHRIDEESLHALTAELGAKLAELEGSSESVEALERRAQHAKSAYFDAARTLSSARAARAEALAEIVSTELKQLGLPDGEFRVALRQRPPERCDATGMDQIEFQVRLNPGHSFGSISRVASGGELSRISLALAVLDTGASTIPTYVFDEVDAGIGGGVAEIVGSRLRRIAREHQVLCVTHLPQVASQGSSHYRISKQSDGKASHTNVHQLGADERIEELSRMLAGVEITAQARAHAADMIARAAE